MADTTENSPAPAAPVQSGPSAARASAWRAVDLLIWIYAAAIVGGWAWMYVEGDREWLATLVLFGPRWLCSLPLPFLAIAASAGHRWWMLLVLAATAVFIAGPIMGFQVRLPARASGAPTLRIMTCNIDQRRFSVDALAQLIVDEQPDVVALQEVREKTPFIWPAGWQAVEYDEFIVASRWPVRRDGNVRRPLRTDSSSMRFVVDTPDGEVQVFDVHLSTPRPGLEAVLNRKTLIDPSRAADLEDVILSRSVEMGKTSDWIEQFAGSKIVAGEDRKSVV
jgi:vancomycin resistance protein VanJ